MKPPIELPPEVAREFMKDLRAFLAEQNAIKRDEIAGCLKMWELKPYVKGNLPHTRR
jgi:hypothetical protein